MVMVTGNRIKFILCKQCNESVRYEKFEEHQNVEHGLIARPKVIESNDKTKTVTEKPPRFKLISRRSSRINKDTKCYKCGVMHNPIWEYAESNRGKVQICSYCKPGLVEWSFGSKTTHKHQFLSGSFESSKK